VILPLVALTVIPRLGLRSVRPSAGLIDNRTPVARTAVVWVCALTWLVAWVAPPKQPASDKPRTAQIGSDATRRLEDR
jgi:hypothetical protein